MSRSIGVSKRSFEQDRRFEGLGKVMKVTYLKVTYLKA